MKPKKNPKADLNKNSSLYFVIGLCVILFVSWRAIEWKTYEASDLLLQKLNVDDDDDDLDLMLDDEDGGDLDDSMEVPLEDFGDENDMDVGDFFDDGGFDYDDGDGGGDFDDGF